MSHSEKLPHRKHPIPPRALRKDVLQYLAAQGGSAKHTAVYIHFALDHVDTVQETLDALLEEELLGEDWNGYLSLTRKGKKALARLEGAMGKPKGSV